MSLVEHLPPPPKVKRRQSSPEAGGSFAEIVASLFKSGRLSPRQVRAATRG